MTPKVVSLLAWRFGRVGDWSVEWRPPPVPTMNERMPFCVSTWLLGFCWA